MWLKLHKIKLWVVWLEDMVQDKQSINWITPQIKFLELHLVVAYIWLRSYHRFIRYKSQVY